jgi:bifunctional non-homologous end joining protein LigD
VFGEQMDEILIEGNKIPVKNPEKPFWPEAGITKLEYIKRMYELCPYILPYTKGRLLTTIRYPHGVGDKSFYQKAIPSYAPSYVETAEWNGTRYMQLNNASTLIWLCTQAALEFHVCCDLYERSDYPTYLVFDLDPSEGQTFEEAAEAAGLIHEILVSLDITSYAKTSGASGLQIYIPASGRFDYDKARLINTFFAEYFAKKYPSIITIERLVKNRGKKLYFDYLQMWRGKTLSTAYAPRAKAMGTVSVPFEWQ